MPDDLLEPWDEGSAFAWTDGHVANSIDSWINVRFAGQTPHPVIAVPNLRFGGSGRTDDWAAIEAGVREVRARAREYLQDRGEAELDLVIPYDGSYAPLREYGLSLRFAILIDNTHHYYHIGEIATKRERIGKRKDDFFGTERAMLMVLAEREAPRQGTGRLPLPFHAAKIGESEGGGKHGEIQGSLI